MPASPQESAGSQHQLAGWADLLTHLHSHPLVPAETATIPIAIGGELLAAVQFAHAAGMSTALGTQMSYPVETEPTHAAVQALYFNQGLQYWGRQRLAALQCTPAAPAGK